MTGYDAAFDIAGAREAEYQSVLTTLRRRLESGGKADAVADAFMAAVELWPSANPSDLWTFLIGRIYCDSVNHPPANARLNLEQSWKRTSGWALERVLVRHYSQVLRRHGIKLSMPSKEKKASLLKTVEDPRILPDKADVLITDHSEETERLLGVVHVKASIAERRTDDVPMSQGLIEAGYLSVFWTMDSKSFPSAHPVNRGEFGATDDGQINDKRRDFEQHGHFSACFSYNSNTQPTSNQDAVAKIFVCDFKEPDDGFARFLLESRRARLYP